VSGERPGARVFVLAPTGRDAELTRDVLAKAGIVSAVCDGAAELCAHVADADCLIVAEEALSGRVHDQLAAALARQPPWSDLPILVITRPGADSVTVLAAVASLGNVTALERPVRVTALTTAVHTALRARRRQYELRERVDSLALLAAIVASSDDAIISKTPDGRIVSWNAAAERIFGYTADEAIGRHITLIVPPDRYDEEQMILDRLMAGERLDHFETVRQTRAGAPLDVSLTISPIRDEAGRVIAASNVAREITAQKRAERALREADRRKDEFLAILAHELRNPLAPLRNSVHLLRMSRADHNLDRVTEMMERQINHMVRLVDDLMEVSRITRGTIELRRERLDVADVLRTAVETSQPQIDAGGHRLTVSLPGDRLQVYGDPVRLAQVFSNLLNNAAHHTEEPGEIWLSARREGDAVAVTVRDAGIGIAADMLPRVFEMFTRTNGNRSSGHGGLGIGLALVRSLVEMHGGSVTAASGGPGTGSEFVVRLPAATGEVATARNESPRIDPIFGVRVLVVDDNADAADSLGLLLGHLGADVRVAHSGADALDLLPVFQPELVLLDLGMPQLDGYAVARRIRAMPEYAGITLVALTGWGQEDDRRRSREAGFDFHLIKPTDLAALQALIASLGASRGPTRVRRDSAPDSTHQNI
jgi:PAS domain S-box-containing protein